MIINGDTHLFPILGDPISQVRSPKYLSEILSKRNINAIVPPFQVKSENLSQTLSDLSKVGNLNGFVITIPHKIPSLDLCDELTDRARFVGSVNVIKKTHDHRLLGDNVDGIGYMNGIERLGFQVANKKALLIGAGGAGSAVAFEILERGADYLGICDISTERLKTLVDRLSQRFPGKVGISDNNPKGYDLIANVTPAGMNEGDPYPVQIEHLTSAHFVADSITKPEITPMLTYAQSLGCTVMPGAGMFDAEAEILIDFLTQ